MVECRGGGSGWGGVGVPESPVPGEYLRKFGCNFNTFETNLDARRDESSARIRKNETLFGIGNSGCKGEKLARHKLCSMATHWDNSVGDVSME